MTIVSIHQPVYLPWLGFFKKIMESDIFVFLDDVQFVRGGFNRNIIRVKEGTLNLTVPIQGSSHLPLNKTQINNQLQWNVKHLKSIDHAYNKCEYYSNNLKFFQRLYEKNFDFLLDLNMEIINYLLKKFTITTETIRASELNITSTGSDRILDICKKLKATSYLSGIHGKNYLKLEDFKKNNIKIDFQNFQHPIYKQRYEPFIPNMASIDLLFKIGRAHV